MYPSQCRCNPLDAIIVSHVHKTTRPLPKFRATKPTQQIATREASPTFGHANANLNDYHYSFLQKLVPYTVYKHRKICICIIKCRAGFATDREHIELHPIFLIPNITSILIIHSGPVARTVPIKNHGQDSSTSQLESIRFKYLRLK